MTCIKIIKFGFICFALAGCSSDSTHDESHTRSDATLAETDHMIPDSGVVDGAIAPDESRQIFTHKMIKQTGENQFASLAYECPQCSFEQWDSIDAPEGWIKGPPQVALFSNELSTMRSYPTVEGHPESVDFLEDVPGNEYRVIAITHTGRLIGIGSNGVVAQAEVQRDTRLVFIAGTRVHELTDPDGNVFVLFVHHVDEDEWANVDFQSPDALDYLSPPNGWTYSTRILDEALVLDSNNSNGIVSVLAIRGTINSAWEKR